MPRRRGRRKPRKAQAQAAEGTKQGLNLTQLPKDVLTALLRQLSRKQQATLRLVCKQLADIIRLHTTQASTTQRMTRQAAQALDSRFPQLASLTCTRPVSMHYICQLTRLTSIRLGDKEADNMYQLDLAPLEELPELHSLHLESVELHTLKPTSFCGLAALTQLKHLCLDQCEAAEESDRPSGFHNFSALPQTTYLQVLDSIDGDVRGVANLHKVEALELQDQPSDDCTKLVRAALQTCERLHTLLLTGLMPLNLTHLALAPRLECLALTLCFSPDLSPLTALKSLKYLDLSNSSFGRKSAVSQLPKVLRMRQLQLCILKVMGRSKEMNAAWQQSHLKQVLVRGIQASKIQPNEQPPEEWWLCSPEAGDVLRSQGLLHGGIWRQLQAAQSHAQDSRLLTFLKMIAAGCGERNVAIVERLHAFRFRPLGNYLPGQRLYCHLQDDRAEFDDVMFGEEEDDDEDDDEEDYSSDESGPPSDPELYMSYDYCTACGEVHAMPHGDGYAVCDEGLLSDEV